MFSFRIFVKNGFLQAIGNMPDYWVILNAAGYMDKGVLLEEDLVELQTAIDAHNALIEAAESAASPAPPQEEEMPPNEENEPAPQEETPQNTEPESDPEEG